MKLNRFICSLALAMLPIAALACGAFDALTSNPFVFHFYQEDDAPTIDRSQRDENIALWQAMTSASIPSSQIESAIYGTTLEQLRSAFDAGKGENLLLNWIISHKSNELKDFLLLAKELEELRFNRRSKWYYPAYKSERYDSGDEEAKRFASILERCNQHTTGFLSDRYGVQYMRALMTLGKYDECIGFYDKHMSELSDDSLLKRMAKGYAAGCHMRLDNSGLANEMFAEIGDFNSIIDDKKSYFNTIVGNNPESDVVKSRLNRWIGYGNRTDNIRFIDVADAALNSSKIVNRGDWLYLKAFIEEIYNQNHAKAISLLKDALMARFSKEAMRRDAKIMELCLTAEQGILCNDLRYYVEIFQTDSNPLFFYIIPALLKKGRVSEALLLANYASCVHDVHENYASFDSLINDSQAEYEIHDNTYAATGFQVMLSRSAQEIINYKKFLSFDSDIVKKCIGQIRHDDDYINEIIGTLFLREGNYEEAEKYLSQVSESYQHSLNIKKCGYLFDNPWVNCYIPGDKWEYPSSKNDTKEMGETLSASFNPANSALLTSDENAKLNFAHEMVRLKTIMRTGTPDDRGLARIRYALARYNSFVDCWALTQYWLGDANQCNYRPYYWLWNGEYKELDYLKDVTESIPDQDWLDAQIEIGIRELLSPDALAEAQFLIGNYQVIAKKYPDSYAGKYLSIHCDSWSEWL